MGGSAVDVTPPPLPPSPIEYWEMFAAYQKEENFREFFVEEVVMGS